MDKRRRPRALTLTLPNSKHPFLLLEGKTFTLRNFSSEGMGLWVPEPVPAALATGKKLHGDVVVGSQVFPVSLEVRHKSIGVVGLRLISGPTELVQIFKRLMEPAFYAADLRPQGDSGKFDPAMGSARLHYTSESTSELLVWFNEFQRMILGLQICWQGKWVSRFQFKPRETGYLKDDTRPHGVALANGELIEKHPFPDPDILSQAAQFLTSVPGPLPGHLLWQFLETGEQVYLPANLVPHQVA